MSDDTGALILALATENAELRAQLAEAQELLVETAVDAGELHALIEDLRAEVAALRATHEAVGERMFCSEDETQADGWRAPRG